MEKFKEVGVVRINDFLNLDGAKALTKLFITKTLNWKFVNCFKDDVEFYSVDDEKVEVLRCETKHVGFGYHYDALLEPDSEELKNLHEFLLTQEVKEVIYENTGLYYNKVGEIFCARYLPGDYLGYHGDGQKGRVGFVYHLSPTWNFTWGGITYLFSGNADTIPNVWEDFDDLILKAVAKPKFNSLLLLDVSNQNYHFVSNLSPTAPYPRMSINGWIG